MTTTHKSHCPITNRTLECTSALKIGECVFLKPLVKTILVTEYQVTVVGECVFLKLEETRVGYSQLRNEYSLQC